MDALLIGYARVSTDHQDLTAQREALAACRGGDTLVVTKLDLLARSLPDARAIVEDLTAREAKLNLGGSVHDPTDPVGRLLFNVLAAMVGEFEADLIVCGPGGDAGGRAKGRLRGKRPKLSARQEELLASLHRDGTHSVTELGELFGVGRSTVYRAIQRDAGRRARRLPVPLPSERGRSPRGEFSFGGSPTSRPASTGGSWCRTCLRSSVTSPGVSSSP